MGSESNSFCISDTAELLKKSRIAASEGDIMRLHALLAKRVKTSDMLLEYGEKDRDGTPNRNAVRLREDIPSEVSEATESRCIRVSQVMEDK